MGDNSQGEFYSVALTIITNKLILEQNDSYWKEYEVGLFLKVFQLVNQK
jgi:hypothetical protein